MILPSVLMCSMKHTSCCVFFISSEELDQFIFTKFGDRHLVLLLGIASWTSGVRSWENWLQGLFGMKRGEEGSESIQYSRGHNHKTTIPMERFGKKYNYDNGISIYWMITVPASKYQNVRKQIATKTTFCLVSRNSTVFKAVTERSWP